MSDVVWSWPDHEAGDFIVDDEDAFARNPMAFNGLIQLVNDADLSKDWDQDFGVHRYVHDSAVPFLGCVMCSPKNWGDLCKRHAKELRAWQ